MAGRDGVGPCAGGQRDRGRRADRAGRGVRRRAASPAARRADWAVVAAAGRGGDLGQRDRGYCGEPAGAHRAPPWRAATDPGRHLGLVGCRLRAGPARAGPRRVRAGRWSGGRGRCDPGRVDTHRGGVGPGRQPGTGRCGGGRIGAECGCGTGGRGGAGRHVQRPAHGRTSGRCRCAGGRRLCRAVVCHRKADPRRGAPGAGPCGPAPGRRGDRRAGLDDPVDVAVPGEQAMADDGVARRRYRARDG